MRSFKHIGRLLAWMATSLAVCMPLGAIASPQNSPYPDGAELENTIFSATFGATPKTVDPSVSFSSNETNIVYNTYEPLFRYHYLKRPYTLQPLGAEVLPEPVYLDASGNPLSTEAPPESVAESVYDIKIRRGMRYAPHPAFARRPDGSYTYFPIDFSTLQGVNSPQAFPQSGTREVTAHDFVYAIKRLGSPRVPSPAFASIERRIIGLDDYAKQLAQEDKALRAQGAQASAWLDLRNLSVAGVQALDDYTLRIRVRGKDPQIKYWMAMNFFAPIPWEADRFYSQAGMTDRNLTLSRWPVGSGPYMLTDFQLNRGYTLERNPEYWGMAYPCEGEQQDRAEGRLDDCGKPTPFIDKAVFVLEKESVPLQGKFLQGYYESPGLERTEYGKSLLIAANDYATKAELYKERKLQLPKVAEQSSWMIGFNWLDPVVGKGDTPEQAEKNRKLRAALSIAFDWHEYLAIFQDSEGVVSQSPIPPGIFGNRDDLQGVNLTVNDIVDGKPVQKSLEEAKRLLAEAGYPDGRNAKTGAPLVLNYDYQLAGGSDPRFDWMRRSLARIGVQFDLRATDFNRFQEKLMKGTTQMFLYGWVADYPDAENFLTLFYGPNSKVGGAGENATNYSSPAFDKLYEKMILLDDGPEKMAVLDQMVKVLQHDSPSMWGYNPTGAGAFQQWVGNVKPSQMVRNSLQFLKLDPALRGAKIKEWNQPIWWPLGLFGLLIAGVLFISWRTLRRTQRQTAFGSARNVKPSAPEKTA